MGRVNLVAVGAQGSLAPSDRSGDQGRCLSLGPLACQVSTGSVQRVFGLLSRSKCGGLSHETQSEFGLGAVVRGGETRPSTGARRRHRQLRATIALAGLVRRFPIALWLDRFSLCHRSTRSRRGING
jgi:hypothetical protein